MAQPGNFTPILIYGSSTPTNVPLAANLTNSATGSEIAINVADKNLFFKDSGGTVNTVPIRQSGTSSNGWLSSTDWNTFNSKAPATSGTSLLYGNGSGGFSNVTIGTGITFAGGTLSATGSGGTVTSVTGTSPVVSSGGTTPAISLATAYGDTLNPYASKTANYILAAPNGSAGVPTFRALVAADLPSLSGTYIPYTGASSAIDLNAQTATNIAHLGLNSTAVPDILLRAYGDNNSTSRIAIRGYSSNASSSSIRVAKFRGTFASPQAPLSGDSLGKFELAGYGTTSSSGYPQASYEGVATENWGATARGTKALFYVTPNTTITQAVALTIDQDKSATFASTVTATSFSGSGSSLTGVVTSVTGTSPVVSSGGTTPAISMPAATTSVNGYLTSTDWNTFNNKGSGTVTNVAALTLGTTGTDLSSTVATGTTTPVITLNVPTASATNRGALSAADWTTFNNKQPAGTYVTSVTGTAPVVSSGGTTPAISMAAATTSVSGYLTSTDWNTFNNKTSNTGTVTSVAASVPAFLSISGSPITTSGTLAISYSGTALPVANGGTGLTSLTAKYIPYGNGTGAFSSSASFNFDGTKMGIGTSAPNSQLEVNGGILATGSVTLNTSSLGLNIGNAASAQTGSVTGFVVADAGGYGGYNDLIIGPRSDTGNFGNIRFYTGNSERTRIFSSGGVSIGNTTDPGAGALLVNSTLLVGTTSSAQNIANGFNIINVSAGTQINIGHANGSINGTSYATFAYNSTNIGSITQTGTTAVLYNTTSDYRLKSDVTPISNALAIVEALNPVSFTWVDGRKDDGFIAHEIQAVIPNCVTGEKDAVNEDGTPKYQQMDNSGVIPFLVKAIQELNNKFDAYVASHP